MKKMILSLACAALAPMALAQTSTRTIEPNKSADTSVNVLTGPTVTSIDATVVKIDPGKTIVLRRAGATDPDTYTFAQDVQFVNGAGDAIDASAINPGAAAHVDLTPMGETVVVSRVVVD